MEPPEALQYKLCTEKEIAAVLGVTVKYIRTLKKAGAPFSLGGRTRPEWIIPWMFEHRDDDSMRGKIIH